MRNAALFWRNFSRGLGTSLGYGFGIAIVIFVLKALGYLPLVRK